MGVLPTLEQGFEYELRGGKSAKWQRPSGQKTKRFSMRTISAVLLTVGGLVSIYLFGSGALGTLAHAASWTRGLDLAARPFLEAGPLAFLALGIGTAAFAIGVLVSPNTPSHETVPASNRTSYRLDPQYSTDRVLEVFLAFNVILVAALLGFTSIGVIRSFPALTVGNLFATSAVGVILGSIVSIIFYFRRKPTGQKIRPIYGVSVFFNLLEAFLIVLILIMGCM